MSVSVFARISNVTNISFALLLPLSMYLKHRRIKIMELCKEGLRLGTGYMIGLGLVVVIVLGLGHWSFFVESLKITSRMAQSGGHSIGSLILVWAHYAYYILLACLLLCAVIVSDYFWKRVERLCKPSIGIMRVCYVLAIWSVAIGAWLMPNGETRLFMMVKMIPLALFFAAVLVLFNRNFDSGWFMVLSGGILLFFLLPMGSDSVASNNQHLYPFYISIGLFGVMKSNVWSAVNLQRETCFATAMAYSILLVFMLWKGTVLDSPHRETLCVSPNCRILNGLATTPERARALDAINDLVRSVPGDNKTVIVFPRFPLIYSLMDKKPFLPGLGALYFPANFVEAKIDECNEDEYPLIIEEKYKVGISGWPCELTEYDKTMPIYAVMERAIRQNQYKIIAENEYIRIYNRTDL